MPQQASQSNNLPSGYTLDQPGAGLPSGYSLDAPYLPPAVEAAKKVVAGYPQPQPSLASRIWKGANTPIFRGLDPLEGEQSPTPLGLAENLATTAAGPYVGRGIGAGIQAIGRSTGNVLGGAGEMAPEGQWLLSKILPTKALASLADKVENLGTRLKLQFTPTSLTPEQQKIIQEFDELSSKLRASVPAAETPPEAAGGNVQAARQAMAEKIAARKAPGPNPEGPIPGNPNVVTGRSSPGQRMTNTARARRIAAGQKPD